MDELALIVEDNVDLAEIFKQAFHSAQFKTKILPDGDAAKKSIERLCPHLVLLDIHPSGESEEALVSRIRENPKLEKTIIIIVTADARKADLYHETSADFIMLKPISFRQLRDLAARLHDYSHGAEKIPESGTIINNSFRQ
jgi:DNA-binding response OmpR family regulator